MIDQIQGFRLSPQQKRLWLLLQKNPVYYAQSLTRLIGFLDSDLLWKALQMVIQRHEILRTRYQRMPGMQIPIQCISENLNVVAWRQVSVEVSNSQDQATIDTLLQQEIVGIFDLEQGIALHALLVTFAPEQHFLMLTLPALSADNSTLKNLVSEISAAYGLQRQYGEASEEVVQYVQFSEWQNELLDENDETQPGRNYWQKQQRDAMALLNLPIENKHTVDTLFTPAFTRFTVAENTARIASVAQQYEASPSVFLLTCWQALLWRLTLQSDLLVGTIFDGRQDEELQGIMGLCARCLPLRAHFRANLSFSELLQQLQQTVNDAQNWIDYFWEEEEKLTEQGMAFTAGFEFIELPSSYPTVDLTFEPLQVHSHAAPFGLKLTCVAQDETVIVELAYNQAEFSAQAIQHVANQFQSLLTSALVSPTTPIETLKSLGEAEREFIFAQNQTATEYSADFCVHALFEAQVARTPLNIACQFEGQQITYAELNERANQFARYLRARGVGPDVPVALLVERSIEMVVALWGILKAGGAYVPLDPGYPDERLAFMIQNTQASLLVTQKRLASRLSSQTYEMISLDTDWPSIAQESTVNLESNLPSSQLAYIIYTSGSTGQPKGSMISHRGLANYLYWSARAYNLAEGQGSLVHSSIGFDLTITSLLSPLLVGQRVILLPNEPGVDALVRAVREMSDLSLVKLTPSHLDGLKQLLEPGEIAGRVRTLVIGGEALRGEQLSWWRQFAPGMRFINEYGPTETVVGCSIYEASDATDFIGPVSIGSPIASMQMYVLDAYQQPVSVGVTGEIYIGGIGLARGYWRRPDLTAEYFIPHPFSAESGARLYRTGDLARYRPDGQLEYLGRRDSQVKLHGFRVELGEIEATLRQHAGIQDSVVLISEELPGAKQLLAYVVPDKEQALTVRQLLHLQREGPSHEGSLSELPNGMAIFQHSKSETELIYREIFEDQIYLQHGIALPDDAYIFDVGANIGLFTLFASQHCQRAHVYAFEPAPPVAEILRLNMVLYNVDAQVFECALSSESKTATLTYYNHCSVISGLFANIQEDQDVVRAFIKQQRQLDEKNVVAFDEELDEMLAARLTSQKFSCQVRTLSDVIRETAIERIDLLKIDVEKSEAEVLAGIQDSEWRKIQQIVIEVHDIEGRLERIVTLLKSHGYTLDIYEDTLLGHSGLYNIYAIRHPQTQKHSPSQVATQVWHSSDQLLKHLRQFTEARLPGYMVPSRFVLLEELPLTHNGKLDLRALPVLERQQQKREQNLVLPRTAVEKQLAAIWASVLRLPEVGIHDNFFAIGGDSILGIQAIARANKAGLLFSNKQLFQYQTIEKLAEVAKVVEPALESQQELVTGPVPLTPIQHWFCQLELDNPAHFNQTLLFQLPSATNSTILQQVVHYLLAHHDALRLRLVNTGKAWKQFESDLEQEIPFIGFDFSMLAQAEQSAAIEEQAAKLQTSLNLSDGPMVRAAFFDLGVDQPARLLLIIHHLVVDTVSLRILLEDFEAVYSQLLQGESPHLLPKTTSFQHWADCLVTYARSTEIQQEFAYWLAEPRKHVISFRRDWQMGTNDERSARTISVALGARETQSLLHEVPSVYHTQINDILLTALVQTFARWMDQPSLLVTMESHGREEFIEEINLSRTVGWFTALFPVLLTLQDLDDDGAAIKSVKEQLRAIPQHGLGYGVLLYLGEPEIIAALSALPQPEVIFNYLGQFDQVLSESTLFTPAFEATGPERDSKGRRSHLLEVTARIVGGQLHIDWIYSQQIHHQATIEALAQNYVKALQTLIAHCQLPDAGGYTPSDFPVADLSQKELDEVLKDLQDL